MPMWTLRARANWETEAAVTCTETKSPGYKSDSTSMGSNGLFVRAALPCACLPRLPGQLGLSGLFIHTATYLPLAHLPCLACLACLPA